MKGQWPQLGKDILRDFEQKNENPSLLQRRFTLACEYVLVSRREIESIFFNNGDGWDDFYTKYPGSQGILTLSRVGFNDAKDTAVLYSGSQSNWLNGHGSMVLMKKIAGRWTVLDGATMWVSWGETWRARLGPGLWYAKSRSPPHADLLNQAAGKRCKQVMVLKERDSGPAEVHPDNGSSSVQSLPPARKASRAQTASLVEFL